MSGKALAATAVLVLAGCGVTEVDTAAVEKSIVDEVGKDLGTEVTADCPDQVDWQTGETFTCDVTDTRGTTRQATVTMMDDGGNVEWSLDDPDDPDDPAG